MNKCTITRALISVSDKQELKTLAEGLVSLGVTLISTGGTAQQLQSWDIPVTEISSYTGFPEILDGRVKTLHPRVHAGLLARKGQDDASLAALDIPYIDLVVVNLYPFERTQHQPGIAEADLIEQIDIGGPTLIRASAKNFSRMIVCVDPADYSSLLHLLKTVGTLTVDQRRALASKAFAHTARYEAAIANYFNTTVDSPFPTVLTQQWRKQQDLRYGENPHQVAAFYENNQVSPASLAGAQRIQGKPLSYNNLADADAAWQCVRTWGVATPACVIVKHANPCGVAIGSSLWNAYQRAYACDPTSAFGGVIAFNQEPTAEALQSLLDQQFLEVLILPSVSDAALAVLASKPNLRVLCVGSIGAVGASEWQLRTLSGGLLVQCDASTQKDPEWQVVTQRAPLESEWQDLQFAWQVVRFVKSNAIVFAQDQTTIGIGAGQMSRVDSVRLAKEKCELAGLSASGAVMASDAFFPFRDGVDAAIAAGIRAVIQPGGSLRDQEIIAAANEAGIAMVFTGQRYFLH